jgi:hypothetical protein
VFTNSPGRENEFLSLLRARGITIVDIAWQQKMYIPKQQIATGIDKMQLFVLLHMFTNFASQLKSRKLVIFFSQLWH